MTVIDAYLRELAEELRGHSRHRRRLLAECREHLTDAAARHGEKEAVRRFGSARDLAQSFELEAAARRGTGATVAAIVGVLAVGASTLGLLNAADPAASTAPIWAVVFFACAQTAAVCAVLSTLRAAAMRKRSVTPSDVAMLCRGDFLALTFAIMTLIAAGGAVTGHLTATQSVGLAAGPVVAVVAAAYVLWARSLTRQLDRSNDRPVRSPLADFRTAFLQEAGSSGRLLWPGRIGLLAPVVVVAAVGAFLWDHFDQGSLGSSLAAAGVETGLILVGFWLLGPVLGLRSWSGKRHGDAPA